VTPLVKEDNFLSLAKEVLSIEADGILSASSRLNSGFLVALDTLLAHGDAGRIVAMGIGKSGHVARKIASTLASTGTPAMFVHPAEAGHGDLGMITSRDVVLAISQSGQSEELMRIVPYLKRNRIRIVAMTAHLDSGLARHADAVLDTSVSREACPLGLAPTASTTLALALGDAVAMCLLRARGFTAEMFAATHPHGALGRRLLVVVADVMATGAGIPTVRTNETIRQALIEISRAGLGFTTVLNKSGAVVGVFTDGDLRRAIDQNVDIRVRAIGTAVSATFVRARPEQLAVEAVELMEHHKVSALPVLDDHQALVGALNMRMLLQAGVV